MGAGLPYSASLHTETGMTRVELAAVWRGVNVERIARVVSPTHSFHSPFTISPFALIHAFRA
jgi:hypothetical protein